MLISSGVPSKNLIGLRKRIAMAFLRIVRSPDVNPEIERFEKVIIMEIFHFQRISLKMHLSFKFITQKHVLDSY